MNDLFNSADQIRASVDASAVFAGGGVKSAPLSDQIQFSSIFKSFVDTPQEALAAAQGPAKPFERPENAPKPLDRDTRSGADDEQRGHYDGDRSDLRSDHVPAQDAPRAASADDKPRQASVTKDGLREQSSGTLERASSDDTNTGIGNRPIDVTNVTDDFTAIVTSPAAAQIAGATDFTKTLPTGGGEKAVRQLLSEQVTAQQGKSDITSKSAANIISSALTDNEFTNIGEDLHAAVTKNLKPEAPKTNTHSAADALANRQAHDLSQRLGQNFQAQINVDVDDGAGKQRAVPSQALSNNALLAAQSSSSDGTSFLNSGQQKQGANIAPDRQALNANQNAQNNANANANMAQQNAAQANFAQTLQAQTLGAQQAAQAAQAAANSAPKVAPITADAANVTSINGPAGPSQLSQTAKANPMSAARQPQKPPAPMEQVSVQIQKAINQGADKINIKLHPAHLGRVEVRMDIGKDGQLSAVILAEKPETLDMLQKDIRGLERALQQAGLDTNSNSFNFGLKNNGGQQAEPGRQREDSHGGAPSDQPDQNADEPDQEVLARNAQQYGRNLSNNGGVDIRV